MYFFLRFTDTNSLTRRAPVPALLKYLETVVLIHLTLMYVFQHTSFNRRGWPAGSVIKWLAYETFGGEPEIPACQRHCTTCWLPCVVTLAHIGLMR
jgi:hypothetical protein